MNRRAWLPPAGEYGKVLIVARAAYEASDLPAVKAQCLALLGRAHHAQVRYSARTAQDNVPM